MSTIDPKVRQFWSPWAKPVSDLRFQYSCAIQGKAITAATTCYCYEYNTALEKPIRRPEETQSTKLTIFLFVAEAYIRTSMPSIRPQHRNVAKIYSFKSDLCLGKRSFSSIKTVYKLSEFETRNSRATLFPITKVKQLLTNKQANKSSKPDL